MVMEISEPLKIELLTAPRREALLVTEARASTSFSGHSAGYHFRVGARSPRKPCSQFERSENRD
jgi:hypothetical protein